MAHDKNPVDVFPEMREFWQAAAEGRLLLKRCNDCGKSHYYPRVLCPHCTSPNTEWADSGGRGTIYSFSVARRAAIPCASAIIELTNGLRLSSVIVDVDFDTLKIGQEVVFHPILGGAAPELAFTTAEAAQARAAARS